MKTLTKLQAKDRLVVLYNRMSTVLIKINSSHHGIPAKLIALERTIEDEIDEILEQHPDLQEYSDELNDEVENIIEENE